jgi:nucleoside-diphosphate-sugar epimerase
MKVLVAGASGVIGTRLVPLLEQAGHTVVPLTSKVCDVFDAPALRAFVASHRPDAVVHELTRIPRKLRTWALEKDMAANDRIRTEGTRNLVDAARAAGVRRFVAQSIAIAYAPGPGPARDEDAPLVEAKGAFARMVGALRTLEELTLGMPEGVVLRYGLFYGRGTGFAPGGGMREEVAARRFPVIGGGRGRTPLVHVEDAARATVLALTGPPGVYNVTDDEQPAVRDWLPAYARAIGAKPPMRVPRLVAWPLARAYGIFVACHLPPASNARAREVLGFTPQHAAANELAADS